MVLKVRIATLFSLISDWRRGTGRHLGQQYSTSQYTYQLRGWVYFEKSHLIVHSFLCLFYVCYTSTKRHRRVTQGRLKTPYPLRFQQNPAYALEEAELECLWLKDIRPSRKDCSENGDQLIMHTPHPQILALPHSAS